MPMTIPPFPLASGTPVATETPTRSPGGAAVIEKAPERVRKTSPVTRCCSTTIR